MIPYKEALDAWIASDYSKAKVYKDIEEAIKEKCKIVFVWEGKDYYKKEDTFVIGLEKTIKQIEYNVLAKELERAKKDLLNEPVSK
jgi:hypothetical protein